MPQPAHQSAAGETRVPRPAAWLGALGLLPFIAGSAGVWLLDGPQRASVVFMLGTYSAVILSFMGAIHWGLAMGRSAPPGAGALTVSVLPALLAWVALSLPAGAGMVLMACGFVGVYAMDHRAIAVGHAPPWYRRLRVPLTTAVVGCLALAVAGVVLRPAP